MVLQATDNEFGSPVKFYRFQKKYSGSTGTTYDSRFGFRAGDYHHAENFPSLNCDEQRSIVENHSQWSCRKPSPFVSTTFDLEWARSVAKRVNAEFIAEISPGRAASGSLRYYRWFELVRELDANIEYKAKNYHEIVFLGQIPQEAITWYGTVEESERHSFEDEEGEDDSEDEDEDKEEDDDDDKDEDEKEDEDEKGEEKQGDGPLRPFYPLSFKLWHILTKTPLMDSELLSLSQLKMARDDEQEDSEETEWYDLLTEADLLVDDPDYEGFWGEDSEEVDSDLQGEDDLYDLW